jgi:hypothetical protein
MKKLSRVIALTAILATPALADNSHQQGDEKTGTTMGMHDQQMPSTMHSLMDRIKTEQNPEKSLKLMEEHMEAMQTGMHMMGENMENCMTMMSERGNMMQGMMNQMKEHQAQEKKLREYIHGE